MKRVFGFLLLIALLSSNQLSAQRLGDAEGNSFRMMSYNIHHGEGTDNVQNLSRISSIINKYKCDVVALQEVDSVVARSGNVDMLRYLANETLMYPVFAPAINLDNGKYGVGMLSKERPISSYQVALPGKEARTLLIVEFEKFFMGCTHWDLNETDRLASANIIKSKAEKLDKPFFLAGDFNAYPESQALKALKADFRLLNVEKPDGKESKGMIDYIAAYKKSGDAYSRLGQWVIKEPVASDHNPVLVNIRLKAKKEDIFYAKPYLQNPVDGGITVMWQTKVPTYSWVEYGTDTTNLQRARTLVDGQVICNDLHNKIRIEGLTPGQTYYYRICSQEMLIYQAYYKEFGETAVSPFYSFTLPSPDTKDFTAIIFNDVHKQEATLKGLCNLVKDVDYDFVVFNGDCIDDPANESDVLYHLKMQSEAVGASSVPTFYLRGNHEIRNAYSIGFRALLDYVGDKTYGSFNWGDTRIVMLDCGEDKPDSTYVYYDLNDFTQLREDQVAFLKQELSSKEFKKAKKRVLFNHIPLYNAARRDDGRQRFEPSYVLWQPLLAKAPFDINISAHTHRIAYIPKGEGNGNNFPVVVGGGNQLNSASVMVLQKKGEVMTLKVIRGDGEVVYDLKL
ncbi:endonuclease/exonuclease/phosphatase family metal-dependent hydrolase [Dysgonomonadaceae bacterium PH5-43]|nr:endonuclease/exonuclease/phosphatase family metal-dependent hydrolase [Dysgonomonadaceae bacterium PH5-43]